MPASLFCMKRRGGYAEAVRIQLFEVPISHRWQRAEG